MYRYLSSLSLDTGRLVPVGLSKLPRHAPEWLTQPRTPLTRFGVKHRASMLTGNQKGKPKAPVSVSHPVPPTRVLACLLIHSVAPFACFPSPGNIAVPQPRFLALSRLYTVLASIYKNSIQKSRKNCIQHESARKCDMMSRYDDDSGRMGPAHTFESYANISSKLPPRTQRPLSNQTTQANEPG